ncbi:Nn.00g039460.m01.CDS01 [Neocucurbitaria sp. VM-36]
MEEQASDAAADGVYTKAKASRFHFKSGSKRRSKRHSEERAEEGETRSSKRHRSDDDTHRSSRDSRRRHKHRPRNSHGDRHPTSTRDGAYYDPDNRHRESLYDDLNEEASASPQIAPDEAFRESLFDALADDEGAAYWEGVYGQPVHVYPDTKPGPDGKLERMTEEEYADYVRTKMWEKSHQHILEEREAKQRARQKQKQERQHIDEDITREEAEREAIRQRMEESLRRGEERKRAKEAEAAWEKYMKRWNDLKHAQHIAQEAEPNVRELIPWPVISGKPKHVAKEEIERFLRGSSAWREGPTTMLKIERVRWHPDKMQQRFGQHIDAETMKLVTATFQVVDRLWNEQR